MVVLEKTGKMLRKQLRLQLIYIMISLSSAMAIFLFVVFW